MRSRMFGMAAALMVFMAAATAGAQDKGQTGITMGHPGSIGVLWHVSDRVGVRPEFQFAVNSSEAESPQLGVTSSSDGWTVSPGISVVIYLRRWDNLRTYVSPRFAFVRSTSSFDAAPAGDIAKSTNTSYTGTGSFGAQYLLHPRFSVFAELGLGVTRTTGSTAVSSLRTTGTQWATRTGVGAVLYF